MKSIVNKNNVLKKEFLDELGRLNYQLEKDIYNPRLSKEVMNYVKDGLKEIYLELEDNLGVGNNHIKFYLDNAYKALKNFKYYLQQPLDTKVKEAYTLLHFSIRCVIDAFEGEKVINVDELDKTNSSNKLNKRIDELDELLLHFSSNNLRLEKEINNLEAALNELDEKIIKEDKERIINDLYREVTTINSQLETLNIRRNNYLACYDLLNLIKVNAKELLDASNYSEADYAKAKSLLNLNKLRAVINEPDKALSILKIMNKDIASLKTKTSNIDQHISSLTGNSQAINEAALKYKEELIMKKRMKESLSRLDEEIINGKTANRVEE